MVSAKQVEASMQQDAADNGYFLCSDEELLADLIDGLVENEQRYGYGSCPCRMACGVKPYDVDIICPCEYRDADVDEYGMCYCGLFVDKEKYDDPSKIASIPERRPDEVRAAAMEAKESNESSNGEDGGMSKKKKGEKKQVWRCTVCGYLCARDMPPPVCPICKAKAERFEEFPLG